MFVDNGAKKDKKMDECREVQHGGLAVYLMDVENRAKWRWRTRVADPSPEGFTV